MDRIEFLKRGFLGTAFFTSNKQLAAMIRQEDDELPALKVIGFNHLPATKSTIMENIVLHKADTRGKADHGWLKSYHTFSFANYYNPDRMHFGVLRVLNDDQVEAGMGFGTHPHDNMEIISIPLEGDLEHKDSMGTTAVIRNGDVQVMSAGTGITHSEYNKNADKQVKFLQIWVYPNKRNVTPRYDQITLKTADRHNRFQQILSPDPKDEGAWIHQDAWFSLAHFDADKKAEYQIKRKENGLYIFLLSGKIKVNGAELETRDGLGIWQTETVKFEILSAAEILLMDVPMSL
jgi:redox-sensitive bicupin YhaK (pirin superfamily)